MLELIKELNQTGQPILVGTVSVDKSEYLSAALSKLGIKHNVLNAKHHEKEAEIVANAGQKWAITIATNMAGRGTDIKLGEWVRELGGLIILGTEKHETRRIDNQLRWRAGRQWDPGMTQFLISPNDDIMRIFGGDKLFGVFNSPMFASLADNEPLSQSSMLTRKVVGVQKQVEWHNFDVRKHILEYDDVINKHRGIIYARRNEVLENENKEVDGVVKTHTDIKEMITSQVTNLVLTEALRSNNGMEKNTLIQKVNEFIGLEIIDDTIEFDDIYGTNDAHALAKYISEIATEELDKIVWDIKNKDEFYELEKRIILQSIDELWMRHIDAMSRLREEVAFEWYAQRNPLVVYQEKAYEKFKSLMHELEYKVVKAIFSVRKIDQVEQVQVDMKNLENNEDVLETMLDSFSEKKQQPQGSNVNPLFAHPNNVPKSNSNKEKKTRIRV